MSTFLSEDRIQQDAYIWFHNTYPQYRGLLFAVPNGRKRDVIDAKILKMTGLVSGVSDLIFLFNRKAYLIETKTEKGTQSDNQIEWQKLVESQGFEYFVYRDLETFKSIILNIINEH